jgi:acyl-CoA hydrolase
MSGPLASRTVDDSRVTMTEIVMPEDTNHHGNIFGGRVLALIDKASAIAAMRHCHAPVVTASIDRVDFLAGAREGSILILEAMIHAAFHTSMEVGVTVHAEDPASGARHLTCRALVTLVAVDGSRRPMAVPALQARTEEEAARAKQAAERREHRKTHG